MHKWFTLVVCGWFLFSVRGDGIVERDSEDSDFIDSHLTSQAMKDALQKVNRAVKRTEIKWLKNDVWEDPMTLFQFFKQPPNQESVRMAMAGDVFECALKMVQDKILEHHPMRFKRRVNATDVLTKETIAELAKFSGCIANTANRLCVDDCLTRMYRRYDGMCNNAATPWWGAANIPLGRWRPSQYENDFSNPIGWDPDRLYNSFKLPIVRKVSNDVIGTTNQHVTGDPDYSHMLVVWGQYIDHDMDLTPQSLSTSTFQGLTDCSKTCKNEPPCYPMQVPSDDQRIRDVKCLPFFRSASVCATGDTSSLFSKLLPREQINAVTSFVDASTVYGSSEMFARSLRDLTNDDGLMRVNRRFRDTNNREYLPFDPAKPCVQDRFDASGVNINCFMAGDGRVSEHLTLSAIHTIWVREHNRIARMLKRMNPHWSGEILYQEARKIVGAYHQVVHYKEYAPKILGRTGMNSMGAFRYSANENPTVSNVFATAAFRFGHVTISPDFRRLDENFNNHPQFPTILLHQAFFSPWRMIRQGGMDPILRGLIGRPAKLATTSQIMHEELREKLFALQNKVALDLASLNLQRGRDHALPLYNDWREECGLSRATNFSQLANEIKNETIRDKLEALYGHPGNMDVWMAGLAEDLEQGSRLGPTFSCLIARQFRFLRNGDKLYYENPGVFTPAQVTALNRMTFARALCDNSGLTRVQRDVFSLAEFPRQFVSCDQIPALDLSMWRESPEVANCGTPPSVMHGYWRKCGSNRVMYKCKDGAQMTGASTIQCENGRFTPNAPTCSYINKCLTNKGGCQDICQQNRAGVTCKCKAGRQLTSDGKTCTAMASSMNVAAVAIGVVFGVAIVIVAVSLGVVVYKFMKLRSSTKYRRTGKFSLDNQANAFENPAMKTIEEEKTNI